MWIRQTIGGLPLNESLDHYCESFLMLAANALELQTHSAASSYEAHHSAGPYFPFLYKEVKLDRRIDGANLVRLDKKTAHTQILNS